MSQPTNGMIINNSLTLEPGVYLLPAGLQVRGSNILIEGNGAVLVGSNRQGVGISLENCQHVTIKNLKVIEYYHGLEARNCSELLVEDCRFTSTAEIPANTIFLDIWLPPDQAYGAGITLQGVRNSTIRGNDLQHQMVGLMMYGCSALEVHHNNASYCSGFGFYLSETSDSTFESNIADYCCRYQPREGGVGHMGADAAGFVIVRSSCRNRFIKNYARLGGDGFFLAGLTPQLEPMGCDDNLFEENDGSWSPNTAFEATFSKRNIYRRNIARHCNYGFWLGFSRENILEENIIWNNRQAGLAVENGIQMVATGNQFQGNTHGILLWSKHIPEFTRAVPENDTSRDWLIRRNRFTLNRKAIRIAADQDHGIRPYPKGCPPPRAHRLEENEFEGNLQDIELLGVEG